MFYRKHDRVFTPQSDVLMTKQEHKDECDINLIVKSYDERAIREIWGKPDDPVYAFLPDQMDFQEALEVVQKAEIAFGSLPSKVRERYQNEPGLFLRALHNPTEEEVELFRQTGVISRDEAAAPGGVVAAPASPAASATPGAPTAPAAATP